MNSFRKSKIGFRANLKQKIRNLRTSTSERRPHDQAQSYFFSQLPLEIRVEIYKQLVAELGNTLHITHVNRMTHPKEKYSRPLQTYRPCVSAPEDHASMVVQDLLPNLMAILLCCKLMHAEATDVFYSSITFNFLELEEATNFLSYVPSPQLNLIHSLHINWWQPSFYRVQEELSPDYSYLRREYEQDEQRRYQLSLDKMKNWDNTCLTVSKMESIRKLQVTFVRVNSYGSVWERDMLMPLTMVKGVEDFRIYVPLSWESTSEMFEDPPFQVIRADDSLLNTFTTEAPPHNGWIRCGKTFFNGARLSLWQRVAFSATMIVAIVPMAIVGLPYGVALTVKDKIKERRKKSASDW